MKRTLTYRVCDGCGKSTLDDDIEIERSEARRYPPWPPDQTIDMCNECADNGCFICRRCHSVHNDDNLCAPLQRILETLP